MVRRRVTGILRGVCVVCGMRAIKCVVTCVAMRAALLWVVMRGAALCGGMCAVRCVSVCITLSLRSGHCSGGGHRVICVCVPRAGKKCARVCGLRVLRCTRCSRVRPLLVGGWRAVRSDGERRRHKRTTRIGSACWRRDHSHLLLDAAFSSAACLVIAGRRPSSDRSHTCTTRCCG
jgi:hypothetical protein